MSKMSKMKLQSSIQALLSLTFILLLVNITGRHPLDSLALAPTNSFPGVSRELASFCAARPSLPIDLASMIVHVKKNISFNYKLYLFSADHVFQTGQVIPRDDFRIHSFPVKMKRLNEFWPSSVSTYKYQGPSPESLTLVPSEVFNLKRFMRLVPINPHKSHKHKPSKGSRTKARKKLSSLMAQTQPQSLPQPAPQHHPRWLPEDAHGDALPGDFISHDVAHVIEAQQSRAARQVGGAGEGNLNQYIRFDRDDQLSLASRRARAGAEFMAATESQQSSYANAQALTTNDDYSSASQAEFFRDSILPVGSFSSFQVNITYLVRKDFGQLEPELVRISVDASQFLVTQLHLISNGTQSVSSYPQREDYDFLSHKLLRDPNTRITAINQIYEDWITRNFYTVVYIQRRLDADTAAGTESEDEEEVPAGSGEQTIVNDRLVFRGASIALVGADQLDYSVKAAAFITEKNGLHYYLEFLPTGKFYLCAVDWTKRPFKMIDSRRFPMKATKVQFDNEELLLCPPAVCYSEQPIDEVVSYGRINLPDAVQRELLSQSTWSKVKSKLLPGVGGQLQATNSLNETNLVYTKQQKELANRLKARQVMNGMGVGLGGYSEDSTMSNDTGSGFDLSNVIEAVKLGSGQLQTRLHLRDWVWTLPRGSGSGSSWYSSQQEMATVPINVRQEEPKPAGFEWRYELARRNDIKVKPDTYGFVLTGHEIEASYRVYNELYLISANHLITINYTLANETVTSTHPIGDEFLGLSSTLLDPITGAFYDRYANQIFFFKGARYVGYDYASKKPLDDFLLQGPSSSLQEPMSGGGDQLVSSLPVVEVLGRQHYVDGVYHDLASDLVFIFTGMKFYTFSSKEFKDGSFKPETNKLPPMHCINERFLDGCYFDKAFQNPCQSDSEQEREREKSGKLEVISGGAITAAKGQSALENNSENEAPTSESGRGDELNFSDEQQMKLRSIASRAGLLNLFVENSLLTKGAARAIEPLIKPDEAQGQEKAVVFYLLTALIVLTVLLSIVLAVIIINWAKFKLGKMGQKNGTNQSADSQQQQQQQEDEQRRYLDHPQSPQEPVSRYLSNQQHHHYARRHQYHGSRTAVAGSRNSQPVDRSTVKPLGSVSVVVAKGRRHGNNMDNSAL